MENKKAQLCFHLSRTLVLLEDIFLNKLLSSLTRAFRSQHEARHDGNIENFLFFMQCLPSTGHFWTHVIDDKLLCQHIDIYVQCRDCINIQYMWHKPYHSVCSDSDHEEHRVKLKAPPLYIDDSCPGGILRQALLQR